HTRWPRDWSSDVCSSDLSGSSAGTAQRVARITPNSGHGQWARVRGPGAGRLGLRTRRQVAFHPTGQADSKCFHRKLQRQDARRVPERTLVPDSERSSPDHRSLEKGLQRGSAPQLTGQPDPARVHSARGNSPVAYGSLRAAAERRTKGRDDPGTHIMIGSKNGGRSAQPSLSRTSNIVCPCSESDQSV